MSPPVVGHWEAVRAFLPVSVQWLLAVFAVGVFFGWLIGFLLGVWLITSLWLAS